MNAEPPLPAERCFAPFHDPVDAVVCVSADARAADLSCPGQRFPLWLDDRATLREHLAASTHAPASSRFGPFADNILGLNWRLPSGKVARIGERVVKTTTGYDWLRFLLHASPRFGEPVDCVLRLRPDVGPAAVATFHGPDEALHQGLRALLHSPWMPWWDAVDLICFPDSRHVRVTACPPPGEAALYAAEWDRVATLTGTRLDLTEAVPPPRDGLPDLVLKTTPDRAPGLARALVGPGAATSRAIASVYPGVVHVHLPDGLDPVAPVQALVAPHLPELHDLGGHWHSRHLPAPEPGPAESAWLRTLEAALRHP